MVSVMKTVMVTINAIATTSCSEKHTVRAQGAKANPSLAARGRHEFRNVDECQCVRPRASVPTRTDVADRVRLEEREQGQQNEVDGRLATENHQGNEGDDCGQKVEPNQPRAEGARRRTHTCTQKRNTYARAAPLMARSVCVVCTRTMRTVAGPYLAGSVTHSRISSTNRKRLHMPAVSPSCIDRIT